MAAIEIYSGIEVNGDGVKSFLTVVGRRPHRVWESAPEMLTDLHEQQRSELLLQAEVVLATALTRLLSPRGGE